jgi:hypothetical protein
MDLNGKRSAVEAVGEIVAAFANVDFRGLS